MASETKAAGSLLLVLVLLLSASSIAMGAPVSTNETDEGAAPAPITSPQVYYKVVGDMIYKVNTATGKARPLRLFGVNWFGFETPDHVVHGLWARNWTDMLVQIRELGFNAIRLPFCTESVMPGTMPTSIDYYKNPDLQGLTSLEIMKKIVEKAGELGIYVLLDYHRIGCNYIEPLWYTDEFSEDDYIYAWLWVAEQFSQYPNVIGADLKNEPHSVSQPPAAYTDGSGATWGMGGNATDWNLAAERIGRAILQVAPHWLIFVEGTQYTRPDIDGSYEWGYNAWWGGNLMAVGDYPVNLPREKLVYSPHVYGPDVYDQPYFNTPDFPENLPEIWYHHFGYVKLELGYPVVIGEFGGRYGHGGDSRDVEWQNKLVDWMIENGFCDFFYWSWNPNSGDTGGILKDDWTNIWEDKYANLKRLMDACSQPEGLPSVEISANRTTVPLGGHVLVEWSIQGADGWESNFADQPSGQVVLAPNETITLYIKAWNNNGTINKTLTIHVETGQPGQPGQDCITISYPEEEWPTAEIDLDGDGANEYVIEVNPWNIESAQGYARMTYCPENNTAIYRMNLTGIQQRDPSGWVDGYPEMFYGNKPWNQYEATDGQVQLPALLSEADNFTVTLSYRVNPDPGLPINFALESWLTRDPDRTSGVMNGEQELMIWLYYQGLQPAGSKVGEVTVPVTINGTRTMAVFEVWKGYIGWEYIAFRIKTPIKAGQVTIPYAPFISAAANITSIQDYTSLYLMDVEVGTEYGSPSTTTAAMSWKISNLTVEPAPGPILAEPPADGGNETGPQPPSEPGQPNGSLSVELVNSWGSGAQYSITVNLDQPTDYKLLVKLPDANISDIWGASIAGTRDGYVVIEPEEWNTGPTAEIGFVTSGSNPLVEEVILVAGGEELDNWTAPAPEPSSLSVEIVIDSEWDTGFVAKIYVTNNGDTPISSWNITIMMTSQIQNIWGATAQQLSDEVIVLVPASYVSLLMPGQTVEIGFVAIKQGSHPYPELV